VSRNRRVAQRACTAVGDGDVPDGHGGQLPGARDVLRRSGRGRPGDESDQERAGDEPQDPASSYAKTSLSAWRIVRAGERSPGSTVTKTAQAGLTRSCHSLEPDVNSFGGPTSQGLHPRARMGAERGDAFDPHRRHAAHSDPDSGVHDLARLSLYNWAV
jgi:hypothetical protein